MPYMRHTMGQDWGGRHRANPKDTRRVARSEVELAARAAGYDVRRGTILPNGRFVNQTGWAMWWWRKKSDPTRTWLTLGDTNFLALSRIHGHMRLIGEQI